jgi:hypothetical protein
VKEWDRAVDVHCKPIAAVAVDVLHVDDVVPIVDALKATPTVARYVLSVIRRALDREVMLGHRGPDTINSAEWRRVKLIRPIKHSRAHHPSMPYCGACIHRA